MLVTIASGKGGTGKTTVAVNLAVTAAAAGRRVTLLDCDAEDPDCHIFLRPEGFTAEPFAVEVPAFTRGRCDFCGRCGEVCRFNAVAALKDDVLIFPELCHSCGGCWEICPRGALKPVPRVIGEIRKGSARGIEFVEGRLTVGERTSVPIIREVKRQAAKDGLTVADAPPGTACPMVAAARDSDFVLLVTEPTPFGLYDLELAVAVVRELGLRCGVFVNRAGEGEEDLRAYCASEGLEILGTLPDDRRVAEVYAGAGLIVDELPEYRGTFEELLARLESGSE
ncbi:MAG TPA: ATP-binding protein [bacterium]|nr:ATP-binding protein [bacterium]